MTIKRRTIVLFGAAVASGVAQAYLRPTKPYAKKLSGNGALDKVMPARIPGWRELDTVNGIVSPDAQSVVDNTYSQTLSRTYVNAGGSAAMMLSLAYGESQSRTTQVHKPEVCYAAQGFKISEIVKDQVDYEGIKIPVVRLVGSLNGRVEPITYWIRSGDVIVQGWMEQNLARAEAGLHGYLPDGLLFRISEVSSEKKESYRRQDGFIRNLLTAMQPADRWVLLGNLHESHQA